MSVGLDWFQLKANISLSCCDFVQLLRSSKICLNHFRVRVTDMIAAFVLRHHEQLLNIHEDKTNLVNFLENILQVLAYNFAIQAGSFLPHRVFYPS